MALALQAAGVLISAVGTFASMQAQAASAEYNAKVQKRNARAARDQASADRAQEAREGRRRLDRVRSLYARSGMIGAQGSALDVYEDQATENRLAELRISYKGENRAVGFEDQAALDKMDAKRYRTAGMIGLAAGVVGAGRALVAGGGFGGGGGGSMSMVTTPSGGQMPSGSSFSYWG